MALRVIPQKGWAPCYLPIYLSIYLSIISTFIARPGSPACVIHSGRWVHAYTDERAMALLLAQTSLGGLLLRVLLCA